MSAKSFENEYNKLERLMELAEILGQQTDFAEILRVVTHQAVSLLNAEIAVIMMINPRTHQTLKTVFKARPEAQQRRYHSLHLQVCGWVIKNNRTFFSSNIQDDIRFRKNRFKDLPIKSVMCVPLRIEGVIIGSILLLNKDHENKFDESDLTVLEKLAIISAPFLRNIQKIEQYFTTPLPEAALLSKYEKLGLLGKSKRFIELLHAVEAAARCDVRVLLEGESGTGKELIARAIHQLSARCGCPFVTIDCGAIPENLLESELFGHVKGAFTGATQDRKGLLEEANHGTLFMDEITNLPLEMQAKFMRVLQEGEVRPVGSNKARKIDVRIISASSGALRKMVDNQRFRADLFYRLHVYPIYVPSLNDRREDIPLLANHFLKKFARQQQKQADSFHETVLDFMQQRFWEGNIRELENFVERLVTLAIPATRILDHDILPPDYKKEFKKLTKKQALSTIRKSLKESLSEYEVQLIRQALIENDWNQSQAARSLKISEPTLRYKMKKLKVVKSA
ncbi:MAG: sigma 54-interacting transcriptional regulator [bacterium]